MRSSVKQFGDLADAIFSGRASTRLKRGPDELTVVNMRDVSTTIAPSDQLEIAVDVSASDATKFMLRDGDVLVTNRGTLRAAVVGPGNANNVAGANTVVVRLRSEFPPNVIAAFLRHPRIGDLLAKEFSGSTTPGFSVDGLKSLPIRVPESAQLEQLSAMVHATDQYYTAFLIAAEARRDLALELVVRNLSMAEDFNIETQ
jgi:hypothetical protein